MKVLVRLKNMKVARFELEDPDSDLDTFEKIRAFVEKQVPDFQTILIRIK